MAVAAVKGVTSNKSDCPPIETVVDMTGLWIGIVGLLILSIIGALLIHAVRRHYNDLESSGEGGFTLHDLRQLRDTGRLSNDEYEHMRGLLVGTRLEDPPVADANPDEEVRECE